MFSSLFNLKMRAGAPACKIPLRSALVGASKRAGIVFGLFINSVPCWGPKFFLNLWAIFFQLNLLLARGHTDSELSSYFLTLLVVAGAVIHTVLYNLPSATLSWVYSWLVNRAKFLVVYLGILASFGYFSGASFLSSLVQLRTLFGGAVKNLAETGGSDGMFPYGDLELGFIDVAGVYVLVQGFFISSSGLFFLLQNSMFISLAFIIVFPFCLGTGVFLEGMLLSVGFPLFQFPSTLPKDLPAIVKELDKKLVVKHPNLEKLFVKQPKSFFPYMFKGPDSTKFMITPPHDDFVAAHEEAARKVRGYLLNERVVNVAEFIGSIEQFIKQMELSGRKPTPTETVLYYELVTQVSIYGVFVDPRTGYPCYGLSPEYRATIFLEDPHFKGDPFKALGSARIIVNLGNEVFMVSGYYLNNGELLQRPGLEDLVGMPTKPDFRCSTGFVEGKTASKVSGYYLNNLGNLKSKAYGGETLILARGGIAYKGLFVDATTLNTTFSEKSLPRPNIITDALNNASYLNILNETAVTKY